MAHPPKTKQRPGVSPAWANLPRRRCDDCGKNYKPVRPVKENERGFCSDNCRKSYHKHGGAYRKLKAEMQKLVAKHMAAINEANQTELRILCDRIREDATTEIQIMRKTLNRIERKLGIPTEVTQVSSVSPLSNPQSRA